MDILKATKVNEPRVAPEMAVVIACARQHISEENKEALATLLSGPLDWDVIISNARYHKIIPLLHKTLTANFKKDIPPEMLADITELTKQNSLHSIIVSASLINIIRLFGENGMDVLPVKGPLLAERYTRARLISATPAAKESI